MNKKIILFLSLLIITGCTSLPAQFAPARMTESYAPRTPPEKIELYRSQTPAKKYLEIGAVNACCNSNANELISKLRKTASESGGDAIVGLEITATGGASASVIRYE